jgi:SAM-dependent methyltransferase
MKIISEREGRHLFGLNATGYDDVRPPYPAWMFEALVNQKALFSGAATLEIGAGNGLATRQLVKLGASPLILLEPDRRFSPLLHLVLEASDCNYQIRHEPFEDAELERASLDLVVIATAFHWLDSNTRVKKLSEIVKPNGHVALLWNVFGDLNLADPFHEASKYLLQDLDASPSNKPKHLPFALDRAAREQEFLRNGNFELVMYAESHWPLELNPEQLRKLYEGFSHIARLAEEKRNQILNDLAHLAETHFSGLVIRNMTSPLYLFRRK